MNKFFVQFGHKHLRQAVYFGPFESAEEADNWAQNKVDEYWTYYSVHTLFNPTQFMQSVAE